jgi:hypothetical protein
LILTTSTSDLQETELYLLPPSHPAFSKLSEIFINIKRPLTSEVSLKNLGFVFLREDWRKDRGKVPIATHSSKELSNYIFKFYVSKDYKKTSRLKDRCKFSRRAQKVVEEMHLEKYFFIPKKYLFPLRRIRGEKLNRFMLVEDKVSFLKNDNFAKFWRSEKIYEYLLPVAKLLWHSRIKDLQPSNLKRNEDGKMSLFDTESGRERFKASFVAINYWLKRNKENKGWNYQRFSVLWEKACRKAKKKTPLI